MKIKLKIGILDWLNLICVCPLLILRFLKFGYTFRKIYLGQNEWAIVEPMDYYWLKKFNWYLNGNGKEFYAFTTVKVGPKKTKMIGMHRLIMDPPAHLLVDHRNGISLDNRRSNLRWATQSQNRQNRRKRENTSSIYIGVCFDKQTGKWKARIKTDGKEISLGRYESEIEAAKAYDEAARKYHGEFARFNFAEGKAGDCLAKAE